MIRNLSLAALVLALAACGPRPEPASQAPARAREAALLVTPAAVGKATTATAFDRDAVQRLFPDSDAGLEFRETSGVRLEVIVVRGPGDLSITFHGKDGTLESALIKGDGVRGPRGERIGESLETLGFSKDDCPPTPGRTDEAVVCRRQGQPQLAFVFLPTDSASPPLSGFEWQADPS